MGALGETGGVVAWKGETFECRGNLRHDVAWDGRVVISTCGVQIVRPDQAPQTVQRAKKDGFTLLHWFDCWQKVEEDPSKFV